MSKTNCMIVIGTGAAGALAAIAAADGDAEVELWEQNEKPGRKPFITGKGQCNVTNACDMEELLDFTVNNPRFLYSSLYGFTNQDMMGLLEQTGPRLKVEYGNRIFPQSDKSSDVISTLSGLMRQAGVKVRLSQKADGPTVGDSVCKGIRCGDRMQAVDRVIVITGGLSYPTTGSIGDDLKWTLDSGHRLTKLSPALVPFEVKETETVKELQGLSLKNVGAAVYDGKRGLYRESGEVLFTHFGVNGPVLLSASSFYTRAIRRKRLHLVIDLKSALSREQLGECILRDFSDSRNKQFKNALNHLYPVRLISVITARSGVDPDREVNEATREERHGLAEATRSLEFALTGLRGYREAIMARGGIPVEDVNPSTMGSKKVRGLYSAGEILDLDAVTGGFNPQIAWSTSWTIGEAATS